MSQDQNGLAPEQFTKIRLGFVIGGTERPVCWFQPDEFDLYWGPARPGRSPGSWPIEGTSITVTVPENLDEFPTLHSKFSYHRTGQVHQKVDGRIDGGVGFLHRPDTLAEPLCIGTLVTKRADKYLVGRNLTRRGAVALRLGLDEAGARSRHYFEFFVSPPGTFALPPMLFAPNITTANVIYTASVSKHAILVVRHAPCGPTFSDWQPDVEIWARRSALGDETHANGGDFLISDDG